MRLLYGGIHKRLGFTIQQSGGYDLNYHTTKVSKQLDIPEQYIRDLIVKADKNKLSNYIKLLKKGKDIKTILSYAELDSIKRQSIFSAMSSNIEEMFRAPTFHNYNIRNPFK